MTSESNQIRKTLTEYYRRLAGKKGFKISGVKPMVQGIGHKMYSFHLEYVEKAKRHSENLVLRMGDNEDRLSTEYRVLEKLNSTSIPVPKVYDMGKDMLGSFFIIMEKVEGQDMVERIMTGMTESEMAELWRQFFRILADIHMLDWERAGLGFLGPPVGEYGFIDLVLFQAREWSKSVESFDLTPVLDWLDDHKPPSNHYVLLHGDYHVKNVLVQNGKIVAVVDWERVSIGDPALDVAQVPFFLKMNNVPSERLGVLVDTFLEHYQKVTGRELRNLDYYQVVKAAERLFLFLLIPDVDEEWRGHALETSARQIEDMTQLRMPSSLTRR